MYKYLISCFISVIFLVPSGCTQDIPVGNNHLESLYQKAITDAVVADSSEICDSLWPINMTNPNLEWKIINNQKYVLAGNFNDYPQSYSDTSLVNSWGVIWIFIPRQLKGRMKPALLIERDTLLRISQLLGLPPVNNNRYVVELWVKPEDIYRPAADSEIDDKTAGPYFPANAGKDYMTWFNQNIYDSYFTSGTHYPWTRLGYTYDWAESASEVGVSEYCIRPNSTLFVKKLYPALKYLALTDGPPLIPRYR